jgi:hypothetical protein
VAGNTTTTVQSNQTFYTGTVPIVQGVLNPANSPQTVWDCGVGMNYAEMTTVVTGSPVSFTILLEGTYDGTNWSTIATTTNVGGETTYGNGLIPFTNLRARCTAVSGGSSPTVSVVATASQTPLVQNTSGTLPSTQVAQGGGSLSEPGWLVAEGFVNPIQNITNGTSTANGTVADFQTARESATFQVLAGAGVSAGAVTFFGSIDGVTFTPLTTASILGGTSGNSITAGVLSFTTAGNALVNCGAAGNNVFAMRYFRADITTNFVGGNVNVKVLAY